MDNFEPIREFFYRHHERILNDNSRRVKIVNWGTVFAQQEAIFAGSDRIDRITLGEKNVGYVDYNISPLGDRLHIHMIKVHSEHRRQGIALAALWLLWLNYKLPIVPLHEYPSEEVFWVRAREKFAAAGAFVINTIRYTDAELTALSLSHDQDREHRERLINQLKAAPEWPLIQARFETWKDV